MSNYNFKSWTGEEIAKVIRDALTSPNEFAHDGSKVVDAHVVDGLFEIARAIDRLAYAIREK